MFVRCVIIIVVLRLLKEYPNSYTLTKALAETVVAEEGSDLPVAIVRPSIGGFALCYSGDFIQFSS